MPAYPSADGAAKDQKHQSYACGQHPVSGIEKTKSQTQTIILYWCENYSQQQTAKK